MTAILSLFCSDPLVQSCSPHRRVPDRDYLLDSCSWDLCSTSDAKDDLDDLPPPQQQQQQQHLLQRQQQQHQHLPQQQQQLLQHQQQLLQQQQRTGLARSPTVLSDASSGGKSDTRKPKSQRLRKFVHRFSSALNPLKWSREGSVESNCEPHCAQRAGPSRAVSFADQPSTSYRMLDECSDDESEVQHFAIVDIVPGQQPRWIGDTNRFDRSKWLNAEPQQSRSFDATLQRRRSLNAARSVRLNRRAYSLNRVLEMDAMVRRSELAKRMTKRPESSYVGQLPADKPMFYTNDDEDLEELLEVETTQWEMIARLGQGAQCGQHAAPPRPPKPTRFAAEPTVARLRPAPPRPPKPHQQHQLPQQPQALPQHHSLHQQHHSTDEHRLPQQQQVLPQHHSLHQQHHSTDEHRLPQQHHSPNYEVPQARRRAPQPGARTLEPAYEVPNAATTTTAARRHHRRRRHRPRPPSASSEESSGREPAAASPPAAHSRQLKRQKCTQVEEESGGPRIQPLC